jgi:hypothetical protein
VAALTDDQYQEAVDLCQRVVDAARSDDGGPTVAGHFLARLCDLLNPEFRSSRAMSAG